ncbi:ROK family protein [bacterium]|nr:ROK family protein [bacterium]
MPSWTVSPTPCHIGVPACSRTTRCWPPAAASWWPSCCTGWVCGISNRRADRVPPRRRCRAESAPPRRRPVNKTLIVGADVGGTSVKYALVDAAGRQFRQGEIPTDPEDPAGTIERLAATVQDDLPGERRIAGVGLACAGIVSPQTGLLGRSPNLPGWENSDLAGAIRAAFGAVHQTVANDVNAALYGEYRFGAGRGCQHLVMIALGTGVGGGVLVDGTLLTGFADGAGEIGHMVLELDGAPCPCGNRGCLEAYCGSVGIVRRARELARGDGATDRWSAMVDARGDDLTTRDCYDLAVERDPTALALFAEVGRRLGQAVSSLVNVIAPDRLIVGGGVAQAGDLVLGPCREMVAAHVMSSAGQNTPVVLAELGPFAAAMGASALVTESGATP